MEVNHFRRKLQKLLGVRCVFQESIESSDTARLMLEIGSKEGLNLSYEESTEDVILKYRSLSSEDSKDPNSRSVAFDAMKAVLSQFYNRLDSLWVSESLSSADSVQIPEKRLVLHPKVFSNALHPGLANLLKVVESGDELLMVQSFAKHSLLSIARFHANTTLSSATLGSISGLGAKDIRLRFIVFQLLQVMTYVHSKGVCVDAITPQHLMLDDEMWLYLPVGITDRVLGLVNPAVFKSKEAVERPVGYYEPLTIQWVTGKISNFEYLMAVNAAAGRTMIDALYHPIMPWVTDFTCNQFDTDQKGHMDGLRDLGMTKFRLSKGDAQLETTFRHSDPPHHVPESLSELTYYIYLARVTPMQVLRRVVRDVFVPEHYPHSMARIYEWTPDECIPEFFYDISVFQSIHSDKGLMNLDLPSFAATPADFISYHRGVLESDAVSASLHSWIDLTFGNCLQGAAAIENMNVPLKHTLSASERIAGDSPKLNKNPGFVVLFSSPHPRKLKTSIDIGVKSHIRSPNHATHSTADAYCGDNDDDDDLSGVMSKYRLNNSSKYVLDGIAPTPATFTPIADSSVHLNHSDSFDINALIELDYSTRQLVLYSKFSSLQESSEKHVSSVSVDDFRPANALSISSAYASSLRPPLPRANMRRSLLRPPSDASHSLFKYAGPIDIENDQRCQDVSKTLRSQTDEYRFSEQYQTCLNPLYYLPSESKQELRSDRTKFDQNSLWDNDFVNDTDRVCASILQNRSAKDELRVKQADDMFSIGCIIAELYLGRPILDANIAHLIKVDRIAARRYIYKVTAGLPLAMRRLVVLLLQSEVEARPRAGEILQACLLQDEAVWNQLDLSLQRSGGSYSAFVNFGQNASSGVSIDMSLKDSTNNGLVNLSKVHKRLINFMESEDSRSDVPLLDNPRVELLSDYCSGLFPSYFKTIYRLVGELKLCREPQFRLLIVSRNLDALLEVPLEGLGLAISHILMIIGDATPFRDIGVNQENSFDLTESTKSNAYRQFQSSDDAELTEYSTLSYLVQEYVRVIDVMGCRLGVDGTEILVVPKVIDFFNSLMSSLSLQIFLSSSIWNVLILRAGVKSFLRYFLPCLLTYLSSGSLYNVAKISQDLSAIGYASASPLWASNESTENSEWLQSCPLQDIRRVQQSAVSCVANLIEKESLGPGLVSGYIIPSLLSLIGMPQLALAGYNNAGKYTREEIEVLLYKSQPTVATSLPVMNSSAFENTVAAGVIRRSEVSISHGGATALPIATEVKERPKFSAKTMNVDKLSTEDREKLAAFVSGVSSYNPQDMFVVQSVLNLSIQLSENVISELILSKIFNVTLPDLELLYQGAANYSSIAAFMEVILLLKGLLPSISPEIVQKDYLHPAKHSGISLPRLLLTLPFTPCWTIEDHEYADLDTLILNHKKYVLHLELCRLIVSSSMIAGVEACTECVLPQVDRFFRHFVEAFGMIPIESKTMIRAFELGAELFLPLAQLTGAEAFYTAVPNLNPRLEMWLVSVGSNLPATSPPLPANIWPERTTETISSNTEKKKGFIQAIFGRSSKGSDKNALTPVRQSVAASAVNSTPSTFRNVNTIPTFDERMRRGSTETEVKELTGRTVSQSVDLTPQEKHYPSANVTPYDSTKKIRTGSLPSEMSSTKNISIGNSLLKKYKSPTEGMEMKLTGSKTADVTTTGDEDENDHSNAMELRHFENAGSLLFSVRKGNGSGNDFEADISSVGDYNSRLALHSFEALTNTFGNAGVISEASSVINSSQISDEPVTVDTAVAVSVQGYISDAETEENVSVESQNDAVIVVSTEDDLEAENPTMKLFSNDTVVLPQAILSDQLFDSIDPQIRLQDENHLPPTQASEDTPYIPKSEIIKEINSSQMNYRPAGIHISKAVSNPYQRYKNMLANSRTEPHQNSNGYQTKKQLYTASSKRGSKVGSILAGMHGETSHDMEINDNNRDIYHVDMAWLLSGNGRWNVEKELNDRATKDHQKLMKGIARTIGGGGGHGQYDWNPPAQISLTAPRIAVDVAGDSTSMFEMQMRANNCFRVEETLSPVRCMVVNPIESILMTCSKNGVRLWSLNAHPIQYLSAYKNHSTAPFSAGFMRSGIHAASCDGNIHVWDVETRKSLSFIAAVQDRGAFLSMSIVSPRHGIVPSIGAYGDDQILTTAGSTLSFYDFRCNCSKALNQINEWYIPQLPPQPGHFVSSTVEPLQLTSAATHENYVYAGSSSGGLWVLDRRMGKVLKSFQAHDSAIIKINPLSDRHLLAVSDRSASVWEYTSEDGNKIRDGDGDGSQSGKDNVNGSEKMTNNLPTFYGLGETGNVRRNLSIRNMPDSTLLNTNTVMINGFEQIVGINSNLSLARGGTSDKVVGMPSKSKYMMYCIAGHKLYSSRLPTYESKGEAHRHSSMKEVESDELRLNQTYFSDRKGSKLTRQKLQVTSSVLLPLRRLMLIGTDEGLVRVVS